MKLQLMEVFIFHNSLYKHKKTLLYLQLQTTNFPTKHTFSYGKYLYFCYNEKNDIEEDFLCINLPKIV